MAKKIKLADLVFDSGNDDNTLKVFASNAKKQVKNLKMLKKPKMKLLMPLKKVLTRPPTKQKISQT